MNYAVQWLLDCMGRRTLSDHHGSPESKLSRDYHLHFTDRRWRLVQGHQQLDGRARNEISPHPVVAQGNWTAFPSSTLVSSCRVASAPSLGLGRLVSVCVCCGRDEGVCARGAPLQPHFPVRPVLGLLHFWPNARGQPT